jgi:hypothetical protein
MFVCAVLGLMAGLGGLLALRRDARESGLETQRASKSTTRARTIPAIFGSRFRVGAYVEVRSLEEIVKTLDPAGCLEGLPFMPEMTRCCGKQFRVFKRVDKVIDMVNKTGLRRMSGTVLLQDIRCDGQAHGGCQAGCHLLWKEAWLRKPSSKDSSYRFGAAPSSENPQSDYGGPIGSKLVQLSRGTCGHAETYRCQATELYEASSYLAWWDLRQYLVPVWSGNVSMKEFLSVVSTTLFNCVQRLRGGCAYPHWVGSKATKTPTLVLGLQPGALVKVKTKEEIQKTLDNHNKNRGLWFDHEMLKFCGGQFRVLRNVERLIDEKTGKLLRLHNPCVILDGVTAKGDFHRFYPQNDYILWRDIWLERVL